MLEVPTLPSPSKVPDHHVGFTDCCGDDAFMVVDGDNLLLDYIDITSCNVPCSFFDADGDILPDLEVDPTELLAEFEDYDGDSGAAETKPPDVKEEFPGGGEEKKKRLLLGEEKEEDQKKKKKNGGDHHEVLSAVTTEDDSTAAAGSSSSHTRSQSKKSKTSNKNSHGKRKVDWTPELHRKFVQAVEQLGIDKAVPSRILEIMGIECLTRHNIASHLQKYRSHRKHLMAREAEAASWAHKRQMYAPRTTTATNKIDMVAAAAGAPAWPVVPPSIVGFPPPFCRPLHVWGHPPTALEASLLPAVWPRHLAPPPRPWMVDPAAAYWHHHHLLQFNAARKWAPQAVTQPAMPPPPPASAMLPRFPAPMPGMTMPHPMYSRPIIPPPSHPPQAAGSNKLLATLQLQLDAHPSKESIDAAIGDVLAKPWLPLPLGLKPPSLDSVMSELQKQGIPNIPPPAT